MSDTNISDKAVQKATGKAWEEWYSILDEEDSTSKSHKEIAAWIGDNFDISGWWCQMVTVQYERERGLRKVHEKADGFEAGKSKTFYVGVDKLYGAWIDGKQRAEWLDAPDFEIRTATENKSIRITWPDDTNVELYFTDKGEEKSAVSIQHNKLERQRDVDEKKTYWQTQLKNLNTYLEQH